MGAFESLGSGLAGACTLTLAHQALRRLTPDAPRMDLLGMRSIAGGYRAAGSEPPDRDALYYMAMGGDLVANSLYYSLAGLGGRDGACACGALLGLMAGVGAVALPGPLGLGTGPSARTATTALLSVGLYVLGGLAAGLAYEALTRKDDNGK